MRDLFQFLADKVVGTNISGLNGGKPGVVISQEDYERANRLVEQLNSAMQRLSLQDKELASLMAALQASDSGATQLNARLSANNFEHALAIGANVAVGSDDRRISEDAKSQLFLKERIKAYARSVGLSPDLTIVQLALQMTPQQRYTCNIYTIASADYLVMQNYIANVILAVDTLLDGGADYTFVPASEHLRFKESLATVKQHLVEDLIQLSRVDGDLFKRWFKVRVQALSLAVKFKPGTREIDPESIPPISQVDAAKILRTAAEVREVKQRLEPMAKQVLDIEGNRDLLPSAYLSDAFEVHRYLMKV